MPKLKNRKQIDTMATDYLSALNVGTGLNTTEIIDSLVEAERAPKARMINDNKATTR